MVRRPLIALFGFAMIGTVVADSLRMSTTAAAGATLMTLALLVVAVRRRAGVLLVAWLTAGCLAALSRATTGPPPASVATCGRESGRDGYRESRWRARISGPHEGQRVVAQLETELCDGVWQPRELRVPLSLWDGPETVRGDLIELVLAVEPIEPARNRTEPDPFVRAMLGGIDATAHVRSAHLIVQRGYGLFALVDRARRAAGQALDRRLRPEHAAVARGLVMGDRSALTPLDRDAWADAGLAHLLAVSGMHVTMIVVVVLGFTRFVLGRVRGLAERCSLRTIAALVAIPCAVWFCLWSAAPASAVRATIMSCVGLVGLGLGTPGRALDALCFTGFVMLLEAPLALHDPGFTLSMAAVAALLVLPRQCSRDVDVAPPSDARHLLKRSVRWALGSLRTAVVASLAATAATAPITGVVFGRVSLVAPLTNLVAVPVGATLATPLAIGVVLLAPIAPAFADIASRPLAVLLTVLLATVHVGAALPGAAIDVPSLRGLRHESGLTIDVAYVGQGDGIVVRLPDGATMLVDAGGAITAGTADPGRDTIAPLLRSSGTRTIDVAVVTHPHPDHLGGFAYLARRFAIMTLWSNGQDDEHPTLQALRDNVAAHHGRAVRPVDLPQIVHYGGLDIDVIHPRAAGTSYLPELGANDNAIVLRLRYGERSILLTGDIEALTEHELIVAGAPLHADILKVGHHGSRTSSSDAMLEAVAPRLAIASCGEHNAFGFPHREIWERFVNHGIPLLTTRDHGAIHLHTDGKLWDLSTQRDDAYVAVAGVVHAAARDD